MLRYLIVFCFVTACSKCSSVSPTKPVETAVNTQEESSASSTRQCVPKWVDRSEAPLYSRGDIPHIRSDYPIELESQYRALADKVKDRVFLRPASFGAYPFFLRLNDTSSVSCAEAEAKYKAYYKDVVEIFQKSVGVDVAPFEIYVFPPEEDLLRAENCCVNADGTYDFYTPEKKITVYAIDSEVKSEKNFAVLCDRLGGRVGKGNVYQDESFIFLDGDVLLFGEINARHEVDVETAKSDGISGTEYGCFQKNVKIEIQKGSL